MHNPSAPFPSPEGGGGASVEEVDEAIGAVIAQYGRQLLAARRGGDQQHQEELAARIQACSQDRERLGQATAEEVDRIAGRYAELLKSLEAEKD
ncbi:hypothetical protein ACFYNO_32640 [Kitasatospora sp. NPDC006697]|uniref:hypothetical protein n=1 Tax=Kitasatospora sp. NPDC006697 TaxID=3364020 RepID=UPI0036A8B77F